MKMNEHKYQFLEKVEKKYRIKPEKMVELLKEAVAERKHKDAVR